MSLNESIVEDAAREWFGEQTRFARTLIPAFSQGEKEEDREDIRRLNPVNPSRTFQPLRDTRLPKLLSEELSIGDTANLIQTSD